MAMRRELWRLGLVLVAPPFAASCDLATPALTLNYKQTVILETPSGLVEMSGVFQEVARYSGPVVGYPAHIGSYLVGEGLGADVPGVGFVVQSLVRRSGDLFGTLVSDACGVASPQVSSAGDAAAWFGAVDRAFASSCELDVPNSQLIVVLAGPAQADAGMAYFPDHLPRGLRVRSVTLVRTTEAPAFGHLPNWFLKLTLGPLIQLPLTPPDGSAFMLSKSYFLNGK